LDVGGEIIVSQLPFFASLVSKKFLVGHFSVTQILGFIQEPYDAYEPYAGNKKTDVLTH